MAYPLLQAVGENSSLSGVLVNSKTVDPKLNIAATHQPSSNVVTP
jgi:hypothetical protein